MQIVIHESNGKRIAEVLAFEIVVNTAQDVLELIVKKEMVGINKIILHRENINSDFFELSTGLAGDIFQKFINYHIQLAIVGDFSDIKSESFNALIRESNRGRNIFFVKNLDEAKNVLIMD